VPEACAAGFEKFIVIASKSPGFHDVEGKGEAQEMTNSISAESIMITGESNWIQMRSLRMTRERDNQDVRDRRDPKFGVRSSENLKRRTSNRRPSHPSCFFRKVRESRMNNEIRFTRNALSGDFAAYRHE
jgi:hypothetical protein